MKDGLFEGVLPSSLLSRCDTIEECVLLKVFISSPNPTNDNFHVIR